MKAILIFLALIAFVVSEPQKISLEELKLKRQEFQIGIAECILKSESASAQFKNSISENKDGNLRRVFHPLGHPLSKDDLEVLKNCRFQYFSKLREANRKIKNKN